MDGCLAGFPTFHYERLEVSRKPSRSQNIGKLAKIIFPSTNQTNLQNFIIRVLLSSSIQLHASSRILASILTIFMKIILFVCCSVSSYPKSWVGAKNNTILLFWFVVTEQEALEILRNKQ